MSKTEIMAELPKLTHQERRELMRMLLELEEDVATIAMCDELARERFQMLDAMEAEDAKSSSR